MRSDAYKTDLIKKFSNEILPGFENKELLPIVDLVYNVEDIKLAHDRMENNLNKGKIIVQWEKISIK